MLGLLLLLMIPVPDSLAAEDEAADKAVRLEKLRARIQVLRSSLTTVHGELDRIQAELRVSESDIADHSRKLRTLDRELRKQRGRLDELATKRAAQQQRLSDNQRALAQQVRASYAMGRQGYLKILLSRQDPATIGRTLTYYNYFNRARAQQITLISDDVLRLKALEDDVAVETARLEKLVAEQTRQQQQREEQYGKRRQIMIRLQSSIGSKEKELQQLLQDESRLTRLLEELHKALSDIPPDVGNLKSFSSLQGRLQLPASGKVIHGFGEARNTGKLRWQGLVIEATPGSEVHAVYHGRVAFADWLRNFGWLIIIDHGDGYMSLYAHNEALYKDVGEWVDQNEVIATTGRSGGQKTPGLYFEIRQNGKPKNPRLWLSGLQSR